MRNESEVEKIAIRAKKASRSLVSVSSGLKDKALMSMSRALLDRADEILAANEKDMVAAREKGTSESLLDRLSLDEKRVAGMSDALNELIALQDPIGQITDGWKIPNGLLIKQVRVPLGVVGVIYEARPNVTVDATGIALKAGNAVILRGGSLALNSNIKLTEIIAKAAEEEGIPKGSIQSIPTADRDSVSELMKMDSYLDLIVPRGGKGLIKLVTDNSTVPVLWAGAGNCHIYVHSDADPKMAEAITLNAKVQRPSVCNAAETLLIHKDAASKVLPMIIDALLKKEVTIHGCPITKKMRPEVKIATEDDWYKEYLDLEIAVKVVDSLDEAIDHINTYGSLHSEAIITKDYKAARKFTNDVDAAAVYVNASTRFTDGGEFGMGAEIGISTQKLHSRGPMGLNSLTSTKYVIEGDGQIR